MAKATIQPAKIPLTKPVAPAATGNPPRTISATQTVPASDIKPSPASVKPPKQTEPSELVIREIMVQKGVNREQAIRILKK